jgi:hypothetical protein
MLRLVQLRSAASRSVAVVEEPKLRCLAGVRSIYDLAQLSIASGETLQAAVAKAGSGDRLDYDAVYSGASAWHLLAPIDVPEKPARVLVSGTGLTHLGSARERQAMHKDADSAKPATTDEPVTDSMRMFSWGVEHGRPEPGKIGVAPEWFYKGNGRILRAHGEPLPVPEHADDGGEEAEIAAVYVIGRGGKPYRVGLAMGNEFSDHEYEKKNYLYLAGSKLRPCSLGPELVVGGEFRNVPGRVRIERAGRELWSKNITTGEENMCHSLRNIEHHHFKFESHRHTGDVHVHYLGADALSFGAGVRLQNGDWMEVSFEGFGRPLRNPVQVAATKSHVPVEVHSMT